LLVSRDRDRDALLLVVGEEEDKDQETAAAARVVLRGLGQSSAGWPETSAFIPICQKLGGGGIPPAT
jgi:hypothetical protein